MYAGLEHVAVPPGDDVKPEPHGGALLDDLGDMLADEPDIFGKPLGGRLQGGADDIDPGPLPRRVDRHAFKRRADVQQRSPAAGKDAFVECS